MKCSYCDDTGLLTAICRETASSYVFRCDNCQSWTHFTEHKGNPIKASGSIVMWNYTLHDKFILNKLDMFTMEKNSELKRAILDKKNEESKGP